MSAVLQSIIDFGMEGMAIDIECHLSNGLPGITIVGFANKAIDEAKERVRSAFTNAQLELPRKRITINLAPGDIPKDGTGFDLAIAGAILIASGQCKKALPDKTVVIGELSLNGSLRSVRGIIGKLIAGRGMGFQYFVIPKANLPQAKLVPNITLLPIATLREFYLYLHDPASLQIIKTGKGSPPLSTKKPSLFDFSQVVGQKPAKRALEIAAAGAHNVLLDGPPGTGKSMLARSLPSILPPLSHEDIVEVTHLHSLASKKFDDILVERPFRAPHHSSSDVAIIGGGQNPRPGEISLSHRGVLFFDELPEFNRTAIEALRQPLEDRVITVSRAKDSFTYPANFILIATANPCPCGYFGSSKPCRCLPHQIVAYQRKLSGPIMDRIDMYIQVEEIVHERLLATNNGEESSEIIARRVMNARDLQHRRFGGTQKNNSDMNNEDIKKCARLSATAKSILDAAASKLNISPRTYMRTVKVARTIADLDNSASIETNHIAEALQYRHHSDIVV